MPKSPYSGYTTRYGVKYKNYRVSQCTCSDGTTCCPKCNEVNGLCFVDEAAQLGFFFNKYFEFMWCSSCGKSFCIVMQRREDSYDA